MQAVSALKKAMGGAVDGDKAEDLTPTRFPLYSATVGTIQRLLHCKQWCRLEQALANMVEKVIARQRLGQCKASVRNQATMEGRDGEYFNHLLRSR